MKRYTYIKSTYFRYVLFLVRIGHQLIEIVASFLTITFHLLLLLRIQFLLLSRLRHCHTRTSHRSSNSHLMALRLHSNRTIRQRIDCHRTFRLVPSAVRRVFLQFRKTVRCFQVAVRWPFCPRTMFCRLRPVILSTCRHRLKTICQ